MFCLQCPRAAHAHRLDQFVHSLCRGYFSTISACSIFCMALTYQKNHFNKMLRHLNVACAHICGSKVTKSARVQKCRLGNFSCFPMDLILNKMLGIRREEVTSMYIYVSSFVLLARKKQALVGSGSCDG